MLKILIINMIILTKILWIQNRDNVNSCFEHPLTSDYIKLRNVLLHVKHV